MGDPLGDGHLSGRWASACSAAGSVRSAATISSARSHDGGHAVPYNRTPTQSGIRSARTGMAHPLPVGQFAPKPPWRSWLDKPLSGWGCALGWLASTALFVGAVDLLGGPSSGDAQLTIGSTWAIAHGQLTCAFPSTDSIAPLYPMLSGGLAGLARIGHSVPFPSGSRPRPLVRQGVRRIPHVVAPLACGDEHTSVSGTSAGSSSWRGSSPSCGRRDVAAVAGSPRPSSSWRACPRSGCASRTISIPRISWPWGSPSRPWPALAGTRGSGRHPASRLRSYRNSSRCSSRCRSSSWHPSTGE